MVRVHSGLPYPLAAPVVLPTMRCNGPEDPDILRHTIQQGSSQKNIESMLCSSRFAVTREG
jgi:hypothetical protein